MRERALLLVLVAAAGCTARRVERTPEELATRRRVFLEQVRDESDVFLEVALRRMKVDGGPYDILVLSGGGPHGAFGAGFLKGWAARPGFDLVTGVSVGALIAPYGLLGDEAAYDRIYDVFRHPRADWARFRSIFAIGQDALFDNAGLREFLREELDGPFLRRIETARGEHRLIFVGAANIDLGLLRIWELGGEIARAPRAGSRERIHRILLASAAIPAVFPPVEIDGDLYVDGGAIAQMVMVANVESVAELRRRWSLRNPGRPLPRIRIWVIINSALTVAPQTTQTRLGDVAIRSMLTLTTAALIHSLRQIDAEVALINALPGVECELRYVAIPDDYDLPPHTTQIFHEKKMAPLAELGRRMGADPASWRTKPPELEWPGLSPGE